MILAQNHHIIMSIMTLKIYCHELDLFKQDTHMDEVIVFVYQELQHNGHLLISLPLFPHKFATYCQKVEFFHWILYPPFPAPHFFHQSSVALKTVVGNIHMPLYVCLLGIL